MKEFTLLEVKGLTTVFQMQQGSARAVNDVSFTVDAGETFGLIGESGSGKSVTCLSILGCLPTAGRIEAGSILWCGEELTSKSENEMREIRGKELAYIPQDPTASLNPVLTIGTQIEETIATHSSSSIPRRAQRRSKAVDLLRSVGIPSAEDRVRAYPHQMSGGMRQRSTVAIGLSTEPRLIIADEPTSNLDATIQAQLLSLLRRLRSELSIAMIFVSHDISVVAQMCDRIGVMYAGSMMEIASTEALMSKPAHPYTHALLASIPRVDVKVERLPTIEGQVPDIAEMPSGCPFAPRCPLRMEKCDEAHPPILEIEDRHDVACWKYEST